MKKHIIRKIALYASVLSISGIFTGCPENKVLPAVPVAEMTESFSPELEIVNTAERSNEVPPETVSNPNDILRSKNFQIYFDNTTGCFKGYADLYQQNPQDETYHEFAQTMKAFREAFETFTAYTLQPGQDSIHQWTEDSKIFNNFGVVNSYTNGRGIIPAETSPMNMMLPAVEESFKKQDDSVLVYISDLNEQNGRLPDASIKIKDFMEQYPEKDVLIISYDMPFRGTISAATAELEGNEARQVDSRTFDENVNRKYYIIAFGDHTTLSALCTSIGNNFQEIGVEMQSFLYRDVFYTETETKTLSPDEQIMEENFLTTVPPVFSILDGNGTAIDMNLPEEAPPTEAPPAGDPLDDLEIQEKPKAAAVVSPLANLEICNDASGILTENPKGNAYIFRSIVPDMGAQNAEVSIRLDNMNIYTLDMSQAVIYTYQNADTSGLDAETGSFSWVKAEDTADLIGQGIHLTLEGDTVNIKLDQILSADTNTPLLAISVPVTFSYQQKTELKEITSLPENFTEWINNCKAGSAGSDEAYTKTYAFDSFMDKITGYKALAGSDEDLIKIQETSVQDLPETPAIVSRLNIIISADER